MGKYISHFEAWHISINPIWGFPQVDLHDYKLHTFELNLWITHWSLTNMPDILLTFLDAFFIHTLHFDHIFIEVCNATIYSKLALGQVMAWHQSGTKPFPEAMMTKFRHIYLSSSLNELNHYLQQWGVTPSKHWGPGHRQFLT